MSNNPWKVQNVQNKNVQQQQEQNNNQNNKKQESFDYIQYVLNMFGQTSSQKNTVQKVQQEEDNSLRNGLLWIGFASYAALIYTRYKISLPNQYIVKTGFGIKNMVIKKKTIIFPFQSYQYIDLRPKTYNITINAMSNEKMEFTLPCVFTIGVKDNQEYLKRYAQYLINEQEDSIQNLIQGIIEGETRVLAAGLSIEEIFAGRMQFKESIVAKVQDEINKLGLEIYNANIKELQDSKDSNYFHSLAQKIKAQAENTAKIDIAEQRKRGEIGQKERDSQIRQMTATLEAETKVLENQRLLDISKSEANLKEKQAEYNMNIQLAQINAEKEAQKREEELQKIVEMKRLERETEKERAQNLSTTIVEAEIKETRAKGEANALKTMAEAKLFSQMKDTDAVFFQKVKEAEAAQIQLSASAKGINDLVKAFNGDTQAVVQFLMIERGVFEKIAEKQAQAIQGLNPKINLWNTGSDLNNSNIYNSIASLGKTLPPLLETIQEQTNIKLPEWLMKNSEEINKQLQQQVQQTQNNSENQNKQNN